ncbi:MAG: TMEM175 family protein [Vulcanimicrobiaceae bacterium]
MEPRQDVTTAGLDHRRLDTLIDGVYAIALTLLVLDIRLEPATTADRVPFALWALLPKFGTYTLAFTTIISVWICHYLFNHLLVRSNFAHMLANMPPLVLIALIPFSAATFGRFPESAPAAALYAGNFAGVGLFYAITWWYSARAGIVSGGSDPTLVRDIGRVATAFCLAELLAAALAFVDPWFTIVISVVVVPVALVVVFFINKRIVRAIPSLKHLTTDDP